MCVISGASAGQIGAQPPHSQAVKQRAAQAGEQEPAPFAAGIGAQPVHGQAEAEKHRQRRQQQLAVFKAVQGVAFAEHHINLPQRGGSQQHHAGGQEDYGKFGGIHCLAVSDGLGFQAA